MTNKKRLLKDDSGRGLLLALCVLAVVAILMSPLMASMRASISTTGATDTILRNHYAADAAIEYAINELQRNSNLRSDLITNLGQSRTLPFDLKVNSAVPEIEIVALSADTGSFTGGMLEYALWAQSTTGGNVIDISGAGHAVYGAVHSNDSIRVSGAGNSVSSSAEYVDRLRTSGAGNTSWESLAQQTEVADEYPISWDLDEFSDPSVEGTHAYQAASESQYHYYGSDLHISGAGEVIEPGLYFVDGNVTISGAGVRGYGVTFVATGTIDLSGAGLSFTPYISGLSFFANSSATNGTGAVNITGSGNAGGTVFAPNGLIKLSGAGGQVTGAFIGQKINISGSGCRIYLAEIPLTEATYCGVFDIKATAGDQIIQARVSDCGENGLQVLAWMTD